MREFIGRLFFSNIPEKPLGHNVLTNQWGRFKAVWNNELDPPSDAIGIERILKLALVALQFPFPGIYVRAVSGRRGVLSKHLGIELYVLFKILLAVIILSLQLFNFGSLSWYLNIFFWLVAYMIVESVLYTATLVFCNDVFAKPRSYKRNILLLLCDYTEVVVDFASLYLIVGGLRFTCEGCTYVSRSIDAAYFSFVTAITIGYGDIVVSTDFGKALVIAQTIIFLIYGVLFLNFYISRIEEPKSKDME